MINISFSLILYINQLMISINSKPAKQRLVQQSWSGLLVLGDMEAHKKLVIMAVVLGYLAIASEATYNFGEPQVSMRLCGMNKEDLMACATHDASSFPSPPPLPECCLALSMADFNCVCSFKKYSSMFKSIGLDFSNPSALLARCKLPITVHC